MTFTHKAEKGIGEKGGGPATPMAKEGGQPPPNGQGVAMATPKKFIFNFLKKKINIFNSFLKNKK
jgi:hypothetical protein